MKKKLSIVTTFRNEEKVLSEFLSRALAVLDGLSSYEGELLIVDDSSTDRSLEILKMAAATQPRIRVVVTSRRFGVYPCLFAALQYATGDAVVYLETDLQDPPELIPELVQQWENGADVVYTTRRRRLGENRCKMALTSLAYRVIHWLSSETVVPRDSGDFKLLTRKVVEQLLAIGEPAPYFRGMVSWVGFKQVQVFYERRERYAGETKRALLTFIPLQVFLAAILSVSNKPFYLVACMACVAVGTLPIAGIVLWRMPHLTAESKIIGMLLLGLVTSSQVSLGIVALYLQRMYSLTRKRPLFIIRDIFTSRLP